MLKNRLIKLENKSSQKSHWSGVAFVSEQSDTMRIPALGFEGSIEEGRRKLNSMNGDVVVFTGEDMIVD